MRFVGLVACAGVFATVLAGCGEDSPEKAVYSVAHSLEMQDGKRLCRRLVLDTALTSPERRALQAEPLPIKDARSLLRTRSTCADAFAEDRLSVTLGGALVRSTKVHGGIAVATVRSDDQASLRVPLIERSGKWQIVVSDGS